MIHFDDIEHGEKMNIEKSAVQREKQREYMREYRTRPYVKTKQSAYYKEYYGANRPKLLDNARKWRENNQQKHSQHSRASHLRRKYGLSQEGWNRLFEAQGCRCAVCGKLDPGSRGWHTDHDHETGKVRGILCHGCNLGVGYFKDDPERLRAAALYLEKAPDDPL